VIALSLVLFGCGRRDAQLQKDVVGSWMLGSNFQMTLSPDGSFISHWAATNNSVTYRGTWKIQEGKMVSTITNCVADGFTDVEQVGSVDSYAILRVDSTAMVYSFSNQIISFRRE
jgi:hypothetical protein